MVKWNRTCEDVVNYLNFLRNCAAHKRNQCQNRWQAFDFEIRCLLVPNFVQSSKFGLKYSLKYQQKCVDLSRNYTFIVVRFLPIRHSSGDWICTNLSIRITSEIPIYKHSHHTLKREGITVIISNRTDCNYLNRVTPEKFRRNTHSNWRKQRIKWNKKSQKIGNIMCATTSVRNWEKYKYCEGDRVVFLNGTQYNPW